MQEYSSKEHTITIPHSQTPETGLVTTTVTVAVRGKKALDTEDKILGVHVGTINRDKL